MKRDINLVDDSGCAILANYDRRWTDLAADLAHRSVEYLPPRRTPPQCQCLTLIYFPMGSVWKDSEGETRGDTLFGIDFITIQPATRDCDNCSTCVESHILSPDGRALC
jgi:hypothetical protein